MGVPRVKASAVEAIINKYHCIKYQRQLLLKATTSGTELITESLPDRAGHSQIRTLCREVYLKTFVLNDMPYQSVCQPTYL